VKEGTLTVVWPEYLGQVAVLEVTDDPANAEWQEVTAAPSVADGVGKVTWDVEAVKGFFRVRYEAVP
jgi:hypothetical protein